MSGGTVAIIIAASIILLIVAVLATVIAFMFKYGLILIPTILVAKLFGDRAGKKRK